MVDAQLSRLSSVFDSCFLRSIVFPWNKDSQCRSYGGKGEVVFVVAMNWMRYELLSIITSTNSYVKELKVKVILICFIFGTEFLKCLKYCKGGDGEVEEKTESSTSRTRSIHIFQIILFKMESATLENHIYFLKRSQLQKRSQKSYFAW